MYTAAVQVLRCRLQRNTGGAFRSWEVRLAVGRCVSQLGFTVATSALDLGVVPINRNLQFLCN